MVLFLIGLVSGIVSGMGIGGGTILIPAIVLLVTPQQHIAQSINLIFFIPTAVIALIIHIKNKKVDFSTALPIIFSGIGGACLGAMLAVSLKGPIMKKWFGIFLFAMGCYEIIRKNENQKSKSNKSK